MHARRMHCRPLPSPAMRFGISPPLDGWRDHAHRVEWAAQVADAGIDHVFVADHVSFRGGRGMDGLVRSASLLSLHPELGAFVGVYLLALRHPVVVARQLATIGEAAPGRLTLGVGVGGEDRHEFEVVGVDPATRGRRTDEALAVLRELLAGRAVDHHGAFFDLDEALVIPPPDPPIPIIIGGRSEAALRRTARFGDGWLATWMSPERFAAGIAAITDEATRSVAWQHGYQNWVGIGDTAAEARRLLAQRMEAFYGVPFERFDPSTPYGNPEDIAAFLRPFAAAGASTFNLAAMAESDDAAIDAVSTVKRLLLQSAP